jgi:hypothetical protein
MDQKYLSEIKAREQAATPGSWRWDAAPCNQEIKLVTSHSGGYYVMEFERYGMRNAAPAFQVYEKYSGPVMKRGSKGMVRADKLCKSIPGKEHHVGFDDYIDHPDADFIAHSRADVTELLAEVERLQEMLADSFQGHLLNELDAKDQQIATLKKELETAQSDLNILSEITGIRVKDITGYIQQAQEQEGKK